VYTSLNQDWAYEDLWHKVTASSSLAYRHCRDNYYWAPVSPYLVLFDKASLLSLPFT